MSHLVAFSLVGMQDRHQIALSVSASDAAHECGASTKVLLKVNRMDGNPEDHRALFRLLVLLTCLF